MEYNIYFNFITLSKLGYENFVEYSNSYTFIINAFVSKANVFHPNWFFWSIIGVYLIMPIINKWILYSDLNEVGYFIIIWLITCLFDNRLFISLPINLTYFSGPIGLAVFGYYLRYTDNKILNIHHFILISSIVVIIICVYLGYLLSSRSVLYHFYKYSLIIVLLSGLIFLLFKNINKFNLNVSNKIIVVFHKLIIILAKYSYGIYLTHYPVIYIMYNLIYSSIWMQYDLLLFILIFSGIIIPIIILMILNKILLLNQLIK